MQPGDRITLLDSHDRGEVVRLGARGAVWVRLDDGLELEVDARDVVVIPAAPSPAAQRTPAAPAPVVAAPTVPTRPPAPELPNSTSFVRLSEYLLHGPGLLLVRTSTDRVMLWLANPDEAPAQVVVYSRSTEQGAWRQRAALALAANSLHPVVDLPAAELDQLSKLEVRWQPTPDWVAAQAELPQARSGSFKLSAKLLQRPPIEVPGLEAPALYLPLPAQLPDVPPAPPPLQPEAPPKGFRPPLPTPDNPVVDLHIEAVAPHLPGLEVADRLPLQLAHAQKALDHAVQLGLPELILIHGVGKGVLREKLNVLLKEHGHVAAFFLDNSGRYGRGATCAVLI